MGSRRFQWHQQTASQAAGAHAGVETLIRLGLVAPARRTPGRRVGATNSGRHSGTGLSLPTGSGFLEVAPARPSPRRVRPSGTRAPSGGSMPRLRDGCQAESCSQEQR